MTKNAVVLGGTGMLEGVSRHLLRENWRVLLPSRSAPQVRGAQWIEAEWARPEELASRVASHVDARIQLVIVWVHNPFRANVMRALFPQLSPDAVELNVWGSHGPSEEDVRRMIAASHTVRHVALGSTGGRWLAHSEISAGVVAALEGDDRVYCVGEVDAQMEGLLRRLPENPERSTHLNDI